ncbi:asparaginase domain-containing protein [Paenibacillus sp. FSL W8-1187]|uniref:asparaginase domain-containing protein n=1 Tax=Paenibacillus sp. FSL W8-1187 TaxID=2975339 RepID=UPI0030D6CE2C
MATLLTTLKRSAALAAMLSLAAGAFAASGPVPAAAAAEAAAISANPFAPTVEIPAVPEAFHTSELPDVIVVATGGTLAGKAADGTSFQNYRAGTYLMEDLVAQLPGKEKIADVETAQFGNKGSGSYSLQDLYDLSQTVDAALEKYDGAVVTTGTDTMEEIAYFLDLTVRSEKPVVVTGAMRPWDVIGTDGPANLYNAIKLAGSGKTKGYGTVVMLNDVIQTARDVTKSNAHRMDTFETPALGALGYIDEKNISLYRLTARAMASGTPQWRTPFDLTSIAKSNFPAVEIAYAYQGAGGGAIKQFALDGVKGIVTAGTGAGGLSAEMSAARAEAIEKGVLFVTTTRTGSGTMYQGNTPGIIAGDSLNAQHARILLTLALAFSSDYDTVKGWFQTIGTQDVPASGTVEPAAPAPELAASDLTGHWAEEPVKRAASYGIAAGYPDGTFGPDKPVTRAEFAVMLMNALNVQPAVEGEPFADAASIGEWAQTAVAQAKQLGIVKGYADGSFKPNALVTRAEMAAMVGAALGLQQPADGRTTFADDAAIPAWAIPALNGIRQKGLIDGRDGNRFEPSAATTRAEASVLLVRMHDLG